MTDTQTALNAFRNIRQNLIVAGYHADPVQHDLAVIEAALTAPAEPVGVVHQFRKDGHEHWHDGIAPDQDIGEGGGTYESRTLYASPPSEAARIAFEVQTMKTSCGADYFVMMKRGDQKMSLYSSRLRYQMEYHRAELDWFVNGGEKPDLMAFSEESHPNLYPNEHPADKEPKVDKSARIAELEAEKRELLDALKPFANEFPSWGATEFGDEQNVYDTITIGDLRRAAALHAKLKGDA